MNHFLGEEHKHFHRFQNLAIIRPELIGFYYLDVLEIILR